MTTPSDDPTPTPPSERPAPSQTPTGPSRGRGRGFHALAFPGYRIYFVGMVLRGTAMWMPLVALPWLAVELGASPAEIGIISALLYLPTFFFSVLGGVMADRVDRRTVLVTSQVCAAILGLLMFLIVVGGSGSLVLLGLASLGFGTIIAIEVPVRQAFMTELVPQSDIASAASLHATAFNTTRLFGPVLAGALIAFTDSAVPFLVTAVISLLVAASFFWMDRYRLQGRHRAATTNSILMDLREGISFARHEPTVRWSFFLISVAAMFGFSAFITLAPLFGPGELGLEADGYGAFIGMSGAGALSAALFVTAFAYGDRRRWLVSAVFLLSAIMAGLALAQLVPVAFVLAFFVGASQIALAQNALVSVQSATPDVLRGRVMGFWVMTFQGSSLVGAVLSGLLAEAFGVRGALLLAAAALAVAGVIVALALRRVDWVIAPRAVAPA